MSVLQVKWLTQDFEQGKITREEFESLFSIINRSEQAAQQQNSLLTNGRALRLHPLTRRVLVQLRIYKKLITVVNYLIILSILSFVYLYAQYYQDTGTFPEFSINGFSDVISQAIRKPLPRDVEMAAEFLSSESGWSEAHISQFTGLWQSLEPKMQDQYQQTLWYRSFLLALSLQITEQRTIAKQGNEEAIQRSILLVKLANLLENKTS